MDFNNTIFGEEFESHKYQNEEFSYISPQIDYVEAEHEDPRLILARIVSPDGLGNWLRSKCGSDFYSAMREKYNAMREEEKHNKESPSCLRIKTCFYKSLLDQAEKKREQLEIKFHNEENSLFGNSDPVSEEIKELDLQVEKILEEYKILLEKRVEKKTYFGSEDQETKFANGYAEKLSDCSSVTQKLETYEKILESLVEQIDGLKEKSFSIQQQTLENKRAMIEERFLKAAFEEYLVEYNRLLEECTDFSFIPQKSIAKLQDDSILEEFDSCEILQERYAKLNMEVDFYKTTLKSVENDFLHRKRTSEITYLERALSDTLETYKQAFQQKWTIEHPTMADYERVTKEIKDRQDQLKEKQNLFLDLEANLLKESQEKIVQFLCTENQKGPLALLNDSSGWTQRIKNVFGYDSTFESEMIAIQEAIDFGDVQEQKKAISLKCNRILSRIIEMLQRKVKESKKETDSLKKRLIISEIQGFQKLFEKTIDEYERHYDNKQSLIDFVVQKGLNAISFGRWGNSFTSPKVFKKQKAFADQGYEMLEELKGWLLNLKVEADQGIIAGIIHAIHEETGPECKEFVLWAKKHPHSAARMISDLTTAWGLINQKSKQEILKKRLENMMLITKFIDPKQKVPTVDDEEPEIGEQLKFRMFADLCHALPKVVAGAQGAFQEIVSDSGYKLIESEYFLTGAVKGVVKSFVPMIGTLEGAQKAISKSIGICNAILIEVAKVSLIQETETLCPDLKLAHAVVTFMGSANAAEALAEVMKSQRDLFLAKQAGSLAEVVSDWFLEGRSIKDSLCEWYNVFTEASYTDKAKIVLYQLIFPISLTILSAKGVWESSRIKFLSHDTRFCMAIALITSAALLTGWIAEKLEKNASISKIRIKVQQKQKEAMLKKQVEYALKSEQFLAAIDEQANLLVAAICETYQRSLVDDEKGSSAIGDLNTMKRNIVDKLKEQIKNEDSSEECVKKFFDIVKSELDQGYLNSDLKREVFGDLAQAWLKFELEERYKKEFEKVAFMDEEGRKKLMTEDHQKISERLKESFKDKLQGDLDFNSEELVDNLKTVFFSSDVLS